MGMARLAIRSATLAMLAMAWPVMPAMAQTAPKARPPEIGQQIAIEATASANRLAEAIAALEQAHSGREQVIGLSKAIQAYELGLGDLREQLRVASVREAAVTMRLEAHRDRVSRLLGVLSGMRPDPSPLLLLHPTGPLGTARSGMMLTDVTPAIQAEVDALRAELAEMTALRQLRESAGATLQRGLIAAQQARANLSQAISERVELPLKFTDDPERLDSMIADADTLDALTIGLTPDLDADMNILEHVATVGKLDLPVRGTILRRFAEPDAAGIERPGIVISTRPQALVSAPWAGTIRYLGPFLDYGNVMILEPGAGYLIVLAGMGKLFGTVGEVVTTGAPLGLMGGDDGSGLNSPDAMNGTGATGSETLYMEVRQGAQPVDPGDWFAEAKE